MYASTLFISSSIVFSLLVSSLCYDAPQLICASIFESYNMYECNPNQPFRYFHLHHWWSHSTLRQWMSRPLLLRSPGHNSKKKSFTSVKVKSTNPESFHSNKALTIDIKKPWITNHNLGKNETLLKITAWSVYIQSWKSEIPTWMLLSIHLQWDQPWAHHIQASAGKDPLKIDVTFNQWRGCGKETCWVFSFLGSRQRLWWPFGCNR